MTEYPNWFAMGAQDNFAKYLKEFKGKPDLKFLQLGVFTGDASVWLLDNILTGSNCVLQDVDTWKGSKEPSHEEMDFDDVYETYRRKTDKYINIWNYVGTTVNFLTHTTDCKDCENFYYDFIYIDADHTTVGVLLDAELSWPLLKSGGIMAFDDYTWGQDLPLQKAPAWGIDLFLDRHDREYETLVINSQVWIRKL